MLKLMKLNGEVVAIAPPQIIWIERMGGATLIRTADGQVTVVVESPEDIMVMIEEWRRGLEVARE